MIQYKRLVFLGFPDYRIGTDQTVWTRRIQGNATGTGPWKKLKGGFHKRGYPTYEFWKKGKRKVFTLHRLMLLAFVGPCPEGMECCHEDGDPTNNDLSNLRWGTHSSNGKDMVKHGNHYRPNTNGEANGFAKLTEREVLEIRRLFRPRKVTHQMLADMFHVSRGTIKGIVNRWWWKHI